MSGWAEYYDKGYGEWVSFPKVPFKVVANSDYRELIKGREYLVVGIEDDDTFLIAGLREDYYAFRFIPPSDNAHTEPFKADIDEGATLVALTLPEDAVEAPIEVKTGIEVTTEVWVNVGNLRLTKHQALDLYLKLEGVFENELRC